MTVQSTFHQDVVKYGIMALPDDVLIEVCKNLSVQEFNTLYRVNKKFRAIAQKVSLIQYIIKREYPAIYQQNQHLKSEKAWYTISRTVAKIERASKALPKIEKKIDQVNKKHEGMFDFFAIVSAATLEVNTRVFTWILKGIGYLLEDAAQNPEKYRYPNPYDPFSYHPGPWTY